MEMLGGGGNRPSFMRRVDRLFRQMGEYEKRMQVAADQMEHNLSGEIGVAIVILQLMQHNEDIKNQIAFKDLANETGRGIEHKLLNYARNRKITGQKIDGTIKSSTRMLKTDTKRNRLHADAVLCTEYLNDKTNITWPAAVTAEQVVQYIRSYDTIKGEHPSLDGVEVIAKRQSDYLALAGQRKREAEQAEELETAGAVDREKARSLGINPDVDVDWAAKLDDALQEVDRRDSVVRRAITCGLVEPDDLQNSLEDEQFGYVEEALAKYDSEERDAVIIAVTDRLIAEIAVTNCSDMTPKAIYLAIGDHKLAALTDEQLIELLRARGNKI